MTPTLLGRYRAIIERGLRETLGDQGPMGDILRYHVGLADRNGAPADALGKLLRPALVLHTAEELGGSVELALPGAVSLELIHCFSLIHDDVQDRDDMRRGRPAVWAIWGIPQAINAGDLMHAIAVRSALETGAEAAELLVDATAEMIEGQSMDLDFEDRFVPPDEVLRMIDRKTGALFRCAFELGGVCAGAGKDVLGCLRDIGRSLGRAFQIRDDLLGIWGDSDVTGKPIGSDVRRKKKSYPIALGHARAPAEERRRLEWAYAKEEMSDVDVAWVVSLLDRLDVREEAEAAVETYVAEASEAADLVSFSSDGRARLQELIGFLARRET